MKNLKPFSGDITIFFEDVLKSKKNTTKDPTYKSRVEILRPDVISKFKEYELCYSSNKLVTLSAFGFVTQNKSDLIKLYSYSGAKFKKLKELITTFADNRIVNTCQNCTINEVGTFDHFLPKGEFPEFAVNPKNLFPSSGSCNGYKNEIWRHSGKTMFLNLYLNILPEEQYLFTEVNIDGDTISVKFTVENKNNIEVNLFEIISNHYDKLHLPERFSANSSDIIVELKNTIKASKLILTKIQTLEIISAKIKDDKLFFGNNYWKSILSEAIIKNNDLMELFFSKS